ncbi:MAG TPA: hypothetical protein VFO52_08400 [Longimicrobiales bacterium]|nr:hypothetical protein [Longimicrobiales bacterium]
MDPNALAGMAFTLILAAMVGGVILLAPISKRLGLLLEQKLHEKNHRLATDELRQLKEHVQLLEDEVRQLSARQHFTDELLGGKVPAISGQTPATPNLQTPPSEP